jgi:hypothetical protein
VGGEREIFTFEFFISNCFEMFYAFLAFSDITIGFYGPKNLVSQIFEVWDPLVVEVEGIFTPK